jgi:hypothetical protein
MLFEHEIDARRVQNVLPKRFGKYGLRLHPEKTKLVPFRRPRGLKDGSGKPGTFDLLGFTHYWGRSRKGYWVVMKKTSRSRYSRTQKRLWTYLRTHRHVPLKKQHRALCRKLQGHDAYYGVTGNYRALSRLRNWLERAWRRWLSTRSRDSRLSWPEMKRLLKRYPLPPACVVHSVYRT